MTKQGFLNALTDEELVAFYNEYDSMLSESEKAWRVRDMKDFKGKKNTREWYVYAIKCVMVDVTERRLSTEFTTVERIVCNMRDKHIMAKWMNRLPNRIEFEVDKHIERRGNGYFPLGIDALKRTSSYGYDTMYDIVLRNLEQS